MCLILWMWCVNMQDQVGVAALSRLTTKVHFSSDSCVSKAKIFQEITELCVQCEVPSSVDTNCKSLHS